MISFLATLIAHPIVPLFLIVNLAIGIWAHTKARKNSFEDYALASRSLPTGVLVMTLLGTYLSTGDLGKVDRFFAYGMLHGVTSLTAIVSFLFIGTFIAPYLVHFNKSFTVGNLMRIFYGRLAQFITGILGLIFALLIVSAQISTIGTVSKILFPIGFREAVLFFGGCVVIYSVWGGMRAVSYTDVFQTIVALLLFSWVAQKALGKVGNVFVLFENLAERDPEKLSFASHSLFYARLKTSVFWAFPFSNILAQPIVQRMLVVQDKKSVRHMWYVSAFLLGLTVIGIALIALSGIVIKEFKLSGGKVLPYMISGGNILPHMINSLFEGQTLIKDMMFIGILGILLSTMDSYLHAVGISLVEDVIGPLRERFNIAPLTAKLKVRYARVGIAAIGILCILLGLRVNTSFDSIGATFRLPAILIYVAVNLPLILGIIGLKTDRASWISFCVTYLVCIGIFHQLGWSVYDYFLIAMPMATLAYFLCHIYINKGIVTLKRSKATVAEQLWIPTWKVVTQYIKSWLLAPLRCHILASRKIVSHPPRSLAFSMLLFALYTFSSVMTEGNVDVGLANFMALVHLVGIILCIGLMLQGIWPDRLKPYFALYWFFTLFYCLPFGGTLAFLRTSGGAVATILWVGSFVLLAFLIDSSSFFVVGILGSGIAWLGWRLVVGPLPAHIWDVTTLTGGGILLLLIIAIFLFERSREKHAEQRFYWNRTASSILGHDLRHTAQMLGGAGNVLNQSFKIGGPKVNAQGEEGYWIPKPQAQFLEEFSEKMIEQGQIAKKEIHDFSNFIEKQVVGIFEQDKTSMRGAAQEAIQRLQDKLPAKIEITLSGKKDFTAQVLAGVFPNMLYNLIWNAASHGKANEIEVKIDAEKKTVSVRDNGIGIPAHLLPRIFDLNFSTGLKGDKHSGVGLAFVKMVVSASSGKISCHSRHGDKDSFTEFVIAFPNL